MYFNISTTNLFNLIIISAGIGICILCFIQASAAKYVALRLQRYYQILFLIIILYVSAHLVRQLMDGTPGSRAATVLQIITIVEVQSAGIMTYIVSLIFLYFVKDDKTEKRFRILFEIILLVHISLIIAASFFGLVFYFDANNIYHRGPGYLLSTLCPLALLAIDTYLLCKYRERMASNVRIALWFYIIIPVLGILIQNFTYGIQFISIATVITAVHMFLVSIQYQTMLARQQQAVTTRLETELKMSSDIQASQLPRLFPPFPSRKEIDIYAIMKPAKEVGGDFYDFFLIDDNHIGFVIADVSGKGVPAALFMMVSRVLIKSHLQNGESPKEVLKYVNEQLCENNEAQLFVTVWLAVLDISTGKGIAANAGHEHPAICRKDGEYELVIYRHSPAVAAMNGIPFKEHAFELHPGDNLFVYTDGVPEAADSDNQFFGTEKMLNALNRDPHAVPEEALSNVLEDIHSFVGGAEQFDDITMLCIKYNGPNGKKQAS